LSKAWLPFIVASVATPFCLLLAITSAGAGHGDYLWAKILFPYTMLSTLVFKSITIPFELLALLQLPIYGGLLGLGWVRSRLLFAALTLLVIHGAALMACFAVHLENFSSTGVR
jgi:hypothetical protein